MLIYSRSQLTEKELEDRIIKYPHLIEEGLVYLEHQRHTATGRLDILFIDSNNILVVAELKVVEDNYMLFQALDYFDFIAEKIESFARLHPDHSVDVEKYPRLMLIAPSFSPVLINRCKWLNHDIRISLYIYQYVQFSEINNDTILFAPQEISYPPTIITKAPELGELLSYIKEENARGLANNFIEEIKGLSNNIIIDPLQWGKSIKYKGYVICYWQPRQSYIRISTYNDEEEWESFNILDYDTCNKVMDMIRRTIDRWNKE